MGTCVEVGDLELRRLWVELIAELDHYRGVVRFENLYLVLEHLELLVDLFVLQLGNASSTGAYGAVGEVLARGVKRLLELQLADLRLLELLNTPFDAFLDIGGLL